MPDAGALSSEGASETKVNVLREAARRLGTNSLGLPDGFYRPDLLPTDREVLERNRQRAKRRQGTTPQSPTQTASASINYNPADYEVDDDVLEMAYTPLEYDQGFPQLPDGRPFWEQMEFEPDDAFTAFQAYVAQGTVGVEGQRALHRLVHDERL